MQIVLASVSKRRKTILQSLGLDFETIPSHLDEEKFKQIIKDPEKLALKLAAAKASEVRERIKAKEFLIISADTFVVLGKKIINKPKSREEAEKMLWQLSGKTHRVLTGLFLLNHQGKQKKALAVTEVKFNSLTGEKIKNYLDTKVFMDRAGAYGIQDPGCDFVKSYQGSYTNILGLPVGKLKIMLKEMMNNGR